MPRRKASKFSSGFEMEVAQESSSTVGARPKRGCRNRAYDKEKGKFVDKIDTPCYELTSDEEVMVMEPPKKKRNSRKWTDTDETVTIVANEVTSKDTSKTLQNPYLVASSMTEIVSAVMITSPPAMNYRGRNTNPSKFEVVRTFPCVETIPAVVENSEQSESQVCTGEHTFSSALSDEEIMQLVEDCAKYIEEQVYVSKDSEDPQERDGFPVTDSYLDAFDVSLFD